MEGFEAYAEQFRGASLVILRFLKSPHDHLPFNFLERCTNWKRKGVFIPQTFTLFNGVGCKVVSLDLFTRTDNYCALNHISKFTYVARPGMKLKCAKGGGAHEAGW